MPAVPRIARSLPRGPVTRPNQGIPVTATLHWADGSVTEVIATAVAWTHDSVEIRWTFDGDERNDWIAAADVRGRAAPGSG